MQNPLLFKMALFLMALIMIAIGTAAAGTPRDVTYVLIAMGLFIPAFFLFMGYMGLGKLMKRRGKGFSLSKGGVEVYDLKELKRLHLEETFAREQDELDEYHAELLRKGDGTVLCGRCSTVYHEELGRCPKCKSCCG